MGEGPITNPPIATLLPRGGQPVARRAKPGSGMRRLRAEQPRVGSFCTPITEVCLDSGSARDTHIGATLDCPGHPVRDDAVGRAYTGASTQRWGMNWTCALRVGSLSDWRNSDGSGPTVVQGPGSQYYICMRVGRTVRRVNDHKGASRCPLRLLPPSGVFSPGAGTRRRP